QLIAEIKRSAHYKYFLADRFKKKAIRELEAWKLLRTNRGKYTKKLLTHVFDVVDGEEHGRWFGALLATPNRNSIFETPINKVSAWIEYVCFSARPAEEILGKCKGEMRIKGAKHGLVTLLLYLTDPSKYANWVPLTY